MMNQETDTMTDATHHVADGRTKVVVRVGFLGAGKTTLLRHLVMSEEDMTGTVVIVNEFGEVGFDGSLIKRLDSDVIELVSGCVCCTLMVDLTVTLQRILDDLKPRRILIEASGLADPKGIVKILDGDGIRERVSLHRMITILDARCWEIRDNFGHLFFDQMESAGYLLLNKIDLIDRERLPATFRRLPERQHRVFHSSTIDLRASRTASRTSRSSGPSRCCEEKTERTSSSIVAASRSAMPAAAKSSRRIADSKSSGSPAGATSSRSDGRVSAAPASSAAGLAMFGSAICDCNRLSTRAQTWRAWSSFSGWSASR